MGKNNSKRETGPVVKVEHLTKTYGSVKAVDDISFEVRRGEIFGMLGPNGAGKTTTVEIIEGLPQAVLQGFPGTTNAIVSGNEVLVYSNDIPTTMSAILRYTDEMKLTGRLKDLHVREATLEDVFLKLTGRKIRE